jgi:hypothetical protein
MDIVVGTTLLFILVLVFFRHFRHVQPAQSYGIEQRAAAPVCSPDRGGCLTGYGEGWQEAEYQQRSREQAQLGEPHGLIGQTAIERIQPVRITPRLPAECAPAAIPVEIPAKIEREWEVLRR